MEYNGILTDLMLNDGMDEINVSIRMPRALWEASLRLAAHKNVPFERMLRQVLSAELLRAKGTLAATAKTDKAEGSTRLRGMIGVDFEQAESWSDLLRRLHRRGYALREGEAGLELISFPAGQTICTSASLGFTLEALLERFGAVFPDARQPLQTSQQPARRDPFGEKWQKEISEEATIDPKTRITRNL